MAVCGAVAVVAVVVVAGVAVPLIGAEAVATNPYWAKTIPAWDYGTLFLVGTFLGALVSSLSEKTFKWELVPVTWKERFGGRGKKVILV
jgi:hypothetical protein